VIGIVMRMATGRTDNKRAAEHFYDLALAMEIQGEHWRATSYLKAAHSIEELGESVRSISERGELQKIEGVGESIESKLDEYLATGKIETLENVRDVLPEDITLFRNIPTLGTKRTADLDIVLGVRSVDELLRAISEDQLPKVPDLSEEIERKTMEWLVWRREEAAEVPTPRAVRSANLIMSFLKAGGEVGRVALVGPARRKASTVANITLIFASDRPDLVVSRFALCPEVLELTVVERDQAVGKTASGAACMIRWVKDEAFAYELVRSTGSDAHVKDLAARAKELGHRFTVGGLGKGTQCSEEEIYEVLNLPPLSPELREGRALPDGPVAEARDLLGDLHVRAASIDGTQRVSEIAAAAKELGHQYVCFCDRVGGRRMDLPALERRNAAIDRAADAVGIDILKGAEVDIAPDGRLDFPSSALDRLDLVIGSVNTKLSMGGEETTRRVLRALDDPNLDVLGHPTNRVIGLREPSAIDLKAVAAKAAEVNAALEINAYPDRLDLYDDVIYNLYEQGASYSIGTDAAFPNEIMYWDWGLAMARRALLPPQRLLNSRTADELRGRGWRK